VRFNFSINNKTARVGSFLWHKDKILIKLEKSAVQLAAGLLE
jgi:hypothetical protein